MTSMPKSASANDAQRCAICAGLEELRWPATPIGSEVTFNRQRLLDYLRTSQSLCSVEAIDEHALRSLSARPFFGWGTCRCTEGGVRISRNVKTDGTFQLDGTTFFIENKIIHPGRECDIKNAIAQTIEYLNLYDVMLGALLILDAGKGNSADWRSHPEGRLLATLTAEYPLCVVRVRERQATEVFP